MRIDLPQCNFKLCRKCLDGNCTGNEANRAECKEFANKQQLNSGWISVSERLPNENDTDGKDMSVIAIHKASDKRTWHYRSIVDNPFDFICWQPLPSYKEVSE